MNSNIPVMAAAVTETWWRAEYSDAQVNIPGFSVIRSDREGRVGGGCALYLHSSVTPSDQITFSDESNSVVAVYIPNTNCIISSVYRAPTVPVTPVLEILEEFISRHSREDCPPDVFMLGDFNMPQINWTSVSADQGNALIDFAERNFLTQLVREPTRGRNILDIVLTNRVDYVLDTDVSATPMSDHSMVSCVLGIGINQSTAGRESAGKGFKALDYHNADFTAAGEELSSIDWDTRLSSCASDDDGHSFVQCIRDTILKVFEKHSKRKRFGTQRKRDPYLRRLKRRQKKLNSRMKLAKQRCSHQSLIDKLERKLDNTAHKIKAYLLGLLEVKERRAIDTIKSNSRFFWSFVNKHRKLKSSVAPLLRPDGTVTDDPLEKSNILQSQYVGVFSDPSMCSVEEAIRDIPSTTYTLDELDFTPGCIEAALAELDPYAGAPSDDIPAVILSKCRKQLAYPLWLLWNRSFTEGVVPGCLKRQQVTPIFKKGSKMEAKNYRPVALTSHMIKTFERVVRNKVVDHLEGNGIFNDGQHGFRRNRSCLTQLLNHYDNIMRELNNGLEVDVVYLDMEKAFDKVDIKVLLGKLEKYGIRGRLLRWISDFLSDRIQTVVVDGVQSRPELVISGVPQGTVLGPLLFLVYMIDIESRLAGTVLTFADDSKLWKAIRSLNDRNDLQLSLDEFGRWASDNNMSLHQDKFEVMNYTLLSTQLLRELPFSTDNYLYSGPGGEIISPSFTVRDLGVLVSADCTWSKHIGSITAKARRMSGWALSVFRDRSDDTMLTLLKSIIRPQVEYCCPLWSPVEKSDIALVEETQRHFTRRIESCSGMGYWDRLQHLKILSLQRRRERYMIIHVWKVLHKVVPDSTGLLFTEHPRLGTKASVPRYNYLAQKSISGPYESSFGVRGAQLWNAMPRAVRSSASLLLLKQSLGSYLSTIPDQPPVRGYSVQHNNSLLDWRNDPSVFRQYII